MIPQAVMQWRDLVGYTVDGGLSHALVLAVIWQESSGYQWCWNPEPRYRWFWDVRKGKPFRKLSAQEIQSEVPPIDFPCLGGDRDQEWWAQQASWGLMQIMGAVGREYGVKEPFLLVLLEPEINIRIGARYLARLIAREGTMEAALLRWNGGGNPRYPEEVEAKLLEIEKILE